MANPVNGHEWQSQVDDLMYACIFELPGPRDCRELEELGDSHPGCDCDDRRVSGLAPICQDESGKYGRKQRYAKAYPGLRELQVLRDFGDNAIVGSICTRNVKDPSHQDFGYWPAIDGRQLSSGAEAARSFRRPGAGGGAERARGGRLPGTRELSDIDCGEGGIRLSCRETGRRGPCRRSAAPGSWTLERS